MKITTRTPPVRIAARYMMELAALPAEHAGYMLRWGMKQYAEGHGVPVADARLEARMDDRAWSIMMETVRGLIDDKALAAGFVVVVPFEEARRAMAKVSASRVRQVAATAKAVNASVTRAPVPSRPMPTVSSEPRISDTASRTISVSSSKSAPWDQISAMLTERGADPTEINEALERWRRSHIITDVIEAIALLDGRHIAKPVRYLDKILSNALAERRQAMPNQVRIANPGPLMPRGVKRRIKVPPRAGWTFEGWTARGHAQGGATVDMRREVWRNDSGALSYKRPDEAATIPTYDEDPGVYETD